MENAHDPSIAAVLAAIVTYLESHLEQLPAAGLSERTQLVADLRLDSIESAELLSALEDRYEVTLPVAVVQRAVTLGDVARSVAATIDAHAGASVL